jgi:hypothetical protein
MVYFSENELNGIKKAYCTKADTRNYRDLSYYQNKKILLWTRKPGLGDMVMNAVCCDILRNEYGLDVWFGCRENPCDIDFPVIMKDVPSYVYKPDLRKFPIVDNEYPRGFEGGKDHQGEMHPFDFIIDFRYNVGEPQNTIFQCLKEFGIDKIDPNIKGFRVDEDVLPKPKEKYDIVMCCSTGGWKPIRAFRKHEQLKELLEADGYKVLDMSVDGKAIKNKYGILGVLSLVKNAECYIGTETGPTHLVSGVHNKAVIIQAGIHHSAFWNVYQKTAPIELKLSCGGRKCKARKHEDCTESSVCIDNIENSKIIESVKS